MKKRFQADGRFDHLSFDLYTVFKDVLREWKAILLIALAAFFLAYGYKAYTYHETYTMSTTFTVNSKKAFNSVYTGMYSAKDTATAFQQIINSSIIQKKVADSLGMSRLPGSVHVSVVEDTNLITLSVTESDPLMAYRVMNGVLDNYQDITQNIIGDVVLTVLQDAQIPEKPDVPFAPLGAMEKAFAGALVLMILFVGLCSVVQDTVRRDSEVEDKLDATLLGTLFQEQKYRTLRSKLKNRKKKTSILITNPDISFRYVETCKKIVTRIKSMMKKRNAKVLLVTSVSENEGKSTVAANIALALSETSDRVVLVDCDFRKPALFKIFGIDENEFKDLGEALREKEILDEMFYRKTSSGICMILNSKTYPHATELITAGMLESVLDILRELMDYIVIDSAPMSMVADTEEMMELVDAAVMVVRQHTSRVRDINDAIDIINNDEKKLLGCIFNNSGGERFSMGHGYGGYGGYGSHYDKSYSSYGGHYEKRETVDE